MSTDISNHLKPVLLFVVNDSWFFVSHRLPVAVAAIKAGYTVHVLAKEDDKSRQIEDAGCMFHAWSLKPRGKNIFKEVVAVLQVYKTLRNIEPDVVHLVTIKSVLYGGIACRLAKVKNVVIAVAGMGSLFDTQLWLIRKLQFYIRLLYKFSTSHPNTTFIFQNKNDKALFTEMFDIRNATVELLHGSGVDLNVISGVTAQSDEFVVLMGARLIRDKGVFEFISAARQVRKVLPNVRFLLAGGSLAEGHPNAVTKNDLARDNSDSVVEILGHVEDMTPLFELASVVVLPSYYNEGLPKFLAEASAAARPIVTTDHPGCRDAIEPNVTGLLVPVKNIDVLVVQILRLLQDSALRKSMGDAARMRAERLFDINVITSEHLEIYENRS